MGETTKLRRVLSGEIFKLSNKAREDFGKANFLYKVCETSEDEYHTYCQYEEDRSDNWRTMPPNDIVHLFLVYAGEDYENIEFIIQEKDVQKIVDFLSILISSNDGRFTFPVMTFNKLNNNNNIRVYEVGVAEKDNLIICAAEQGRFTFGKINFTSHLCSCIADLDWKNNLNTFYLDTLSTLIEEYLDLFDPDVVQDIYDIQETRIYGFSVMPFLNYCIETYHCKPLMKG